MKLPEIVNTIDIGEKAYEFDSFSEEEKAEISMLVQDSFMKAAGYKRKTA